MWGCGRAIEDGARITGDPSVSTRPAKRDPVAHEEQERPGAERLSRGRAGLEGAHWVEGVLRVCYGDAKRDPAWTRRAIPKETQQRGGGRGQWALIAGRLVPAPGVGAERTRNLTLWTHKNLTELHRRTGGEGGGPKSAPRSRRERTPGGRRWNLGRGAFWPRTVMSREARPPVGSRQAWYDELAREVAWRRRAKGETKRKPARSQNEGLGPT
ncbi:hypothetical protein NDU88_001606 [Pleurodeles waltl]|uniref:Uncharacterized protein n=1 Tax=Pleurodeles waltl TaxID=8319 RepID=A0AAV7NKN7_PLEWA|nr:hypothetical protein NDU88_000107 [Pleurodeles waltl]KAJ1113360.1 hypothetical protein NDU88_001606 [Pleurodeles waltl]